MQPQRLKGGSLTFNLLILTFFIFITTTFSSAIDTSDTNDPDPNPFLSFLTNDPSKAPMDVEFFKEIISEYRARVDAGVQITSTDPGIPRTTTIEGRDILVTTVTAMPPPPPPPAGFTTTLTTLDKPRQTDWTRYGNNHGWAMVCYDQKDHTDYCYRSPRDYYCSSNGFLVRRETWPYGRYEPCERFCMCYNINPRPVCLAGWSNQGTCF